MYVRLYISACLRGQYVYLGKRVDFVIESNRSVLIFLDRFPREIMAR